ncbi:Major facilitator superfamily domain-containing protein 7 [Triplophysa tibetana]|uniref:Major facilitator superfamily domain-containing protein 7 n=1 Tax=Triplophysa tibetana TaxID=1572043 RepID=A0A5A9NL48_9TELE|nr:Major facilitator superfamily domain-containing protein 7 [Triplophysa tibetana]
MDDGSSETDLLVGSRTEGLRFHLNGGNIAADLKVYKRRWFILFVLCLLNCSNAVLWLTFAPVADQTAQYLRVSLDLVNWLSLVYMVVAIFFSFITTWMLDTLGLRFSLILGSWLNMLGSILRVVGILSGIPQWAVFPMVMGGQTLCALAQTLIIFSPTKLAALWFPDDQRATANMIASMANPLGLLFANIFSPMIIHYTNNLLMLLIIYAIPATIACFLATVGIRERVPPTPPSASVVTSSTEPFLHGIKLLLKNKAYMILLVCFGSGIGIFTCFSTLLEQILCVKGYSNDFAGLCGACSIVFGIVGAGILGLYVDKTKQFTEVTKINMCLTSLGCSAFAVVSQLKDMKVAIGAACAWFGLFGFSVYPIAMELGVECSYPVGEATSSGLIFISGQIQSVIYMVLLQALTKPLADSTASVCVTGGEADLSWTVPVLVMAGLCAAGTCCFVLFFHTDYRRLRAEATASPQNVTDQTRGDDTWANSTGA